jgi:hypothetical protein
MTVNSVDALDSFESLHCSATFFLELADKRYARCWRTLVRFLACNLNFGSANIAHEGT